MTNHSGAAGTSGNGDISEQRGQDNCGRSRRSGHQQGPKRPVNAGQGQESGGAAHAEALGSAGQGRIPECEEGGRGPEPTGEGRSTGFASGHSAEHTSAFPERERAFASLEQGPALESPSTVPGQEHPSLSAMQEPPFPFLGGGEATGHAGHSSPTGPCGEQQVTLRTPAELADALPYLLGYRPEDSIVLVALHDRNGSGRFGGRAHLGIPAQAEDWPAVAEQLAHGLVTGSERRGARPESMVAFLCQDPSGGESGRDVMERLRPLAQLLRRACGGLDVPVVEALCISDGRFWSYCCPGNGCCPSDGEAMGLPGASVLAAAATYAGLQVRGTLRELRARLVPWETAAALQQEAELDTANRAVVPRMLDEESRAAVAEETLDVAHRLLGRLADAPPASDTLQADLQDDEMLGHEDAATLILGLQDRSTRDRAAEWMEGGEAGPALRLWRALARRCVGAYGEHAAAPLTLVGWVAWSSGDELEAREALAMALAADPDYLFARLLHQACNEGLDPESIRRCLRAERKNRTETGDARAGALLAGPKSEKDAQRPGTSSTCGDHSSGTGTGTGTGPCRRRRARSGGSHTRRSARRSQGRPGDRRPRSVDGTSPVGDGWGRPTDSTSRRARTRPGAGGCGEAGET